MFWFLCCFFGSHRILWNMACRAVDAEPRHYYSHCALDGTILALKHLMSLEDLHAPLEEVRKAMEEVDKAGRVSQGFRPHHFLNENSKNHSVFSNQRLFLNHFELWKTAIQFMRQQKTHGGCCYRFPSHLLATGKRGEAPKPEDVEKIRSTKVSTEPEHVAQKVRLFSRLAIQETWVWKVRNSDGAESGTTSLQGGSRSIPFEVFERVF